VKRVRIAAARLVPVALAAALALVGCQKRSRYHPLPADSTAVAPDSLAAAMAAAQQRWDTGSGDDAAHSTAVVMLSDLRLRPPAAWADRARALLDSLAIGGEVGTGGGAILVNFFSRSDPEHGSWPYLFWSSPKGARMQALEGRDLAFEAMATLPPGASPATVFVLQSRRAAAGGQPIAFAWKSAAGGAFSLAQTLGPDSLGGSGSGEFAMADTTLELHTRTFRPTRLFEECASCPHLYATHRFRWTGDAFVRISDEPIPSPYATFVRFVQAVSANNRDAARAELADVGLLDEAHQLGWDQPRGMWRVAPSTDETAHEMTFYRGAQEAYRVTFVERGGDWKISGVESTARQVE
jgi:hypothetical protein